MAVLSRYFNGKMIKDNFLRQNIRLKTARVSAPGEFNKRDILAMIPARLGSVRLKAKNLALLNGKPLIYYAIKAAKDSDVFEEIFVNSESEVFAEIAERYGVSFYKRNPQWATSEAKSDFVVYDFLINNPCKIVVWVNPTSPLQEGKEIKEIVEFFIEGRFDSLITVKDEQVHAVFKNKPINFKFGEVFKKTQDLEPVQPFVYSLMIWRSDIFRSTFERRGNAFFCGKVGFYPVSKFSSVIIKKPEDLLIAESLLGLRKRKNPRIQYDKLLKNIRDRKEGR